jgi:hypothetical protein
MISSDASTHVSMRARNPDGKAIAYEAKAASSLWLSQERTNRHTHTHIHTHTHTHSHTRAHVSGDDPLPQT